MPMMFKALKMVWNRGSIMSDVMQQLIQMARDDAAILSDAWTVCAGGSDPASLEETIRGRDKQINRTERTIRRLVLQHLAINPGEDVSGCVAVLLIAKDLERIGDHGRNVFILAKRMPGEIRNFQHFAAFDAIHGQCMDLLERLHQALAHTDRDLSLQILERYQAQKDQIKILFDRLFAATLESREAVASALLARYFKRITAHIGNAASGIIFPVENIDFVSRGLREDEKDR